LSAEHFGESAQHLGGLQTGTRSVCLTPCSSAFMLEGLAEERGRGRSWRHLPVPRRVAGEVGVPPIHGFTGSPAEMRLLDHYLHERGLTVAAPLLPGHGARPAALNRQRQQD
jgi:hypothetical protein